MITADELLEASRSHTPANPNRSRKHERDNTAVLRVLEDGPARYMEILRAAGMTSYALREALNRLIRCKQVVADGVMVITYRKVK